MKKSFAEIIDKDSHGKSFGFSNEILSIECVDLDDVESASAGSHTDKSMDCTFGIGQFNIVTRGFSSRRLLLVELKLNCTKHNLSPSDYTGKITHTRLLLKDVMTDLDESNIFIFTSEVSSKAKSDIFRWSQGSDGKILKTVLVHTPKEFCSYIGFQHEFPYTPLNSTDKISAELNEVANDTDQLAQVIQHWKKTALDYLYKGNRPEYEHITKTVKTIASKIIEGINPEVDHDYLILVLNG